MKSIVEWIPSEKGGRGAPPSGLVYSALGRFPEQLATFRHEAWTVVLHFSEPPRAGELSEADTEFLSPDAPQELLKPGQTFELCEGTRAVARVTLKPD